MNLPTIIPTKRRVGRGRREERAAATPTPPVEPLVLVEANWEEGHWVRMTFDRAIDISAMVVADVTVDDGANTGWTWHGAGAALLVGPTTVQVELVQGAASPTPDTTLSVAGGNGIVAVAPPVGGTWAGVVGLALPWP